MTKGTKKRKRDDLTIKMFEALPCVNCKTLTQNYNRNSICCCSISCMQTYILKMMNEQSVIEQQRGGSSFEEVNNNSDIIKNEIEKENNGLILFDSY